MIPASYLYKDVFTREWGDPRNRQAKAVEGEPRGPDKGLFTGLIGMLSAVMPLEVERGRRVVRT